MPQSKPRHGKKTKIAMQPVVDSRAEVKPPMAECSMGYLHPKPHKYERETWRTFDMHGSLWHEACRICGHAPNTVGFCR